MCDKSPEKTERFFNIRITMPGDPGIPIPADEISFILKQFEPEDVKQQLSFFPGNPEMVFNTTTSWHQ